MAKTLFSEHSGAWRKLGIGTRERPGEIFPKFKKEDFDKLKSDYNNQFGFTIRIPQWDDIVHLTPNEFKTKEQIKGEKKEALTRILESPAPEWARKYSTVMTWIDDIQDTMSIVYPLLSMLGRAAPKVFSKLTPIIGWISVGYDILNILNAIGRAPLTPMKSKREVCKQLRRNPFSKSSRFENVGRIKNYKAGLSDLIQAAQVLDQFTGAGLSLGGIMGAITDSIFGAYRYLNGEPVRWSFDPPDVSTLDILGSRGLKAANAINSTGQVFSDLTHFWSYVTGYCSSMIFSGTFFDEGLTDLVEKPMDMMIPAPVSSDENTIALIHDLGLNFEQGIGWPYNGEKFISAADYMDATMEPCRANFGAYCLRHAYDSYGWLAAASMDSMIPQTILAMDPDATYQVDDTDEMKVFWRMLKAPILPTKPVTEKQGKPFTDWIAIYASQYGKTPGILEIEQKLNMLGIPYKTSYPSSPEPGFKEFWPEGWAGEESY